MTTVSRRFVVVALVAGTLFAVFIPGFTGYDEPYHFLRAWQLSDGHLHSERAVDAVGARDLGARFPATLTTQMLGVLRDGLSAESDPACHGSSAACTFRHLGDPAPGGRSTFVGFPSAAIYAPVPYIPTATAIRVARTLGLSLLATLWLARLAGLVAYVLLIVLAIKRIPRGKTVLAIVALTPVCVGQAAMVSADGITIALAFLAIALSMRLATEHPGLSPARALLEVGALGIALGLSKPPYIVFGLLFLPALVRHRHSRLGRLLPLAFAPGVALFAWWSAYAQSVWLPPPANPYLAGGTTFRNVDESKQLRFVEHHATYFVRVVLRTIGTTWRSLLHDAVAQSAWPGPLAIAVSVALLAYAAIIVAAVLDGRDESGGEPARLEVAVDAIVALGTLVALFLFAYTGWNALQARSIGAFQGRYLVPVLGLVAIGIAPRLAGRIAFSGRAVALAAWAPWLFVAGALVLTAGTLATHYY